MIHRLSVILKKCDNTKYRQDFIKYLSTLEFDEFELLFNKYLVIISRFLNIYSDLSFTMFKNNAIFLSKKWWKNQRMKNKYCCFFKIFNDGNPKFITDIENKLKYKSKRYTEIALNLKDAQIEMENIISVELKISNNKEDLIRTSIYISKTIMIKNKLEKLSEELNKLIYKKN